MYTGPFTLFVQVVDSKSFSKAAKAMFLSPVAVMKRVNAFEEDVGVKLLNRTPSGVTPTAAGKVIYEAGREILPVVHAAFRRAKEVAERERGSVRIGSSRLNPHWLLQDKLADLGEKHFPVNIEIVPFYGENLGVPAKLAMLGEDFDCLICPYDESLWGGKVSVFHLQSLPMRITLPVSHPLATKPHLALEDLHGQTLLFPARQQFSAFDRLRDQLEAEHPQIKLIDVPFYNTEVLNQCLRENLPIVTFDTWFTRHPSLLSLPIDWDAEMPVGLLYQKHPTAEMKTFIEYLEKVF